MYVVSVVYRCVCVCLCVCVYFLCCVLMYIEIDIIISPLCNRWIVTFIFATLFGIPAFVVHVTFYYVHSTHAVFPGLSVSNLVLFILATVVQVRIT